MATELKTLNSNRKASDPVYTLAFAGGKERGRCLQLTQRAVTSKPWDNEPRTLALDVEQVLELSKQCADFLAHNY